MQKAGSLLYAVYVCLLISILTGSLLLVFSLNRGFSDRLQVQNLLIDRCESCLDLYLSNTTEKFSTQALDLFDDGITCKVERSFWGIYQKVKMEAYFKKDTITKEVLIANRTAANKIAIYLADLGEELKVTGKTTIVGNMKLPKNGYKKINILGNSKLNKPSFEGSYTTANTTLPKLDIPDVIPNLDLAGIPYSKFKHLSNIYNGFHKKPLVIDLAEEGLLNSVSLKGNIILTSINTITIGSKSTLEDVIVVAPKIVLEDGFTGSVQLFADEEITLGENVNLSNPSCVVIKSNPLIYEKNITVLDNTSIEGAIVMEGGQGQGNDQSSKISIAKNAKVYGDIYCNGVLELKGNVLGRVYTNKFLLKTKSGEYTNTLMDVNINAKMHDKQFLSIIEPLDPKDGKPRYSVAKQL